MDDKHVHIRNMVCARCIRSVEGILRDQELEAESVTLGEVVLKNAANKMQLQQLEKALEAEGFELLDDVRSQQVSQIKNLLVELIHYGDMEELDQNISAYLAGKMHKDYHYLSNLFSTSENMTIEQFVIFQKIEKVKELLVYGELSVKEIAYKMDYSSVGHLSAQFRKITGFTTSEFRKLKDHKRKPLDKI